ncbi:MAG: DMT family transporter [Pikeienuella sp.]|uniref:DMT family transporter n=1 Tax=Pikeienuella sp. TaxID=2831957 RepID=UPI003919AF23
MNTRLAEPAAPPLAGYVAVILAVVIWGGWIVATRLAMLERHAPLDIALLRYATPAILFAPYWMRKGIFPKGEKPLLLIIMTLGWGGPFVLLISKGMQSVEASLFGPLVPGLLPMIVALWGYFAEGERIRRGRIVGLVFIAAAVALILVPATVEGDSNLLAGAPWLLTACLGWSAFTIAFRKTGLSGIEAAAYVCLYSTPVLIVAALFLGTELQTYPAREVAFQVAVQGFASGAVSVACFGYAVKALGLARASAFTSLVPVMSALGGWLLLGEVVGAAGWAAAFAACLGVLLVNRYAR